MHWLFARRLQFHAVCEKLSTITFPSRLYYRGGVSARSSWYVSTHSITVVLEAYLSLYLQSHSTTSSPSRWTRVVSRHTAICCVRFTQRLHCVMAQHSTSLPDCTQLSTHTHTAYYLNTDNSTITIIPVCREHRSSAKLSTLLTMTKNGNLVIECVHSRTASTIHIIATEWKI